MLVTKTRGELQGGRRLIISAPLAPWIVNSIAGSGIAHVGRAEDEARKFNARHSGERCFCGEDSQQLTMR